MGLETDVNILLDRLLNKLDKGESDSAEIIEIKNELNKITNNGKNCRDLFTNTYYVNNLMLDKEISKVNAESEEEVANKLIKEMEHGQEEHNTS